MMRLGLRFAVATSLALPALACSDPAPPQADAAVSLSIHPSAQNPSACPQISTTYQAGVIQQGTRVTLIDGQGGVSISCSVKGGPPYSFSASFRGSTTVAPSAIIGLTMTNGSVSGTTGTANLQVYTSDLGQNLNATAACTVTVDQIQGGAMLGRFDCPTMQGNPTSIECGASGNFLFENCAM